LCEGNDDRFIQAICAGGAIETQPGPTAPPGN
jgi:hypothetical protein